MSTKIYEGYRFPRNRLDEFIPIFNQICHRSVKQLLKKSWFSDKEIEEAREQIFGKNIKGSNQYSDDDVRLVLQLAYWMRESKHGRNDPFNMDCALNLWLDGKWVYIIPYVVNGMDMQKLMPKWCKYYGYWDNTDQQVGVSDKEWQKRKILWNRIAVDDWDKTRLSHIVFEMKMPHLNGLKSLLRSINRNEDWYIRIYGAASALYWQLKKDASKK